MTRIALETVPAPTAQDERNATFRLGVYQRMAEQYGKVKRLAWGLWGPGWEPRGKHLLLPQEAFRPKGKNEDPNDWRDQPVMVVYCVQNSQGEKRYFREVEGKAVPYASPDAAFGDLLMEPHPTATMTIKGQVVPCRRYSTGWSAVEKIQLPATANQLAERRAKREQRKEERWRKAFPLLALMEDRAKEKAEREQAGEQVEG